MSALPTPYYRDEYVTLYHADCRDVLPWLDPVDVLITDPVWPNAIPGLAGDDDPSALFTAAAAHAPRLAQRLVVQMGCDSDPRFLAGVPAALPFLRACWLEYAQPGYKGRILYSGDVAYVFGSAPPAKPGAHLLPGRYVNGNVSDARPPHPCARRYGHVRWLVRWFAAGAVLDPFAGTGTTLAAAKHLGFLSIGIEVRRDFCDMAVERLRQSVLPLEVAS